MSLKCFPNKVDVKFARQRNCSLDDRKVQCFHARRCPEKEWVGDARMFIRMKQFPLESNRTSLLRQRARIAAAHKAQSKQIGNFYQNINCILPLCALSTLRHCASHPQRQDIHDFNAEWSELRKDNDNFAHKGGIA